MYSVRGNLILAFHGCDKSVCDAIVSNPKKSLKSSENSYDWLGHGVYFWENNHERALDYAKHLKKNPGRSERPIKDPAVLGAVINLGNCLDLVDSESLKLLKVAYDLMQSTMDRSEFEALRNKPSKASKDLLIRELDCAVILTLHKYIEVQGQRPFDSVRAVFFEGNDLYPTAGFREKNHIQICVRNPNCIKGYFLPRKEDGDWMIP